MAFFSQGDRTERATPKRRSEARQKGNVARSPQLAPAVVFLGGFVILAKVAPTLIQTLSVLLQNSLSHATAFELTERTLQTIFLTYCKAVASSIFMIAGTVIVLSVGANAMQGGLVLSGQRLGFHLENLNPASGLKRLMPGNSLGELAKTLAIIVVLAYLSWSAYSEARLEMPRYVLVSPVESFQRIGESFIGLLSGRVACW